MESPTERIESIGPFRVVRVLGTGGSGTVYLGERREQFSQQVAIKVIEDRVFVAEARAAMEREELILASLDHPHIVRLLDLSEDTSESLTDGGPERGRRYLVMEYVDGLPIDQFAEEQKLTVADRLKLLLQVMEAVDYAHQHLVVHADLKPANILVTPQGDAKVLDFGIAARLDTRLAASGQEPHTPQFASPEQLAGERAGVASDIYSLGLVAALLVAGPRGPHGEGVTPQAAAARSVTAAGLAKMLQGDLAAILDKALRPEPEERYPTVEAFQQDVRGWLEGRPIAARPVGAAERAWKWAARNRLGAMAAALLTAVVLLSTAGVVWQAAHAARERRIALARLHELTRLTGVLEGELYGSVAPLPGSAPARGFLIRTATETLDHLAEEDGEDAELVTELAAQYDTLAHVELSVAASEPAARHKAIRDLDRGIELLRGLPPRGPQAQASLGLLQQMTALRRGVKD